MPPLRPPRAAALAAAVLFFGPACSCREDPAEVVWSVACEGLDDFVLAAWGASASDMYFVGGSGLDDRGLILHYDGTRWLSVTGVSDQVLWWVWGASGSDVWAVGEEGEALHFRGGLWSRTCAWPAGCNDTLGTCAADPTLACVADPDCPYVDKPTLYGVWGSAADRVWAVGGSLGAGGPEDALVFWNGSQWIAGVQDEPSGETFFKVWGTAEDDVWAVGTGGIIYHFDGSIWRRTPSPTGANLISLYGTGPDDIWAVGGLGEAAVIHWDGTAWTLASGLFDDLPEPLGLNGVWTSPTASPVIVGHEGFAARLRSGALEPLATGVDQGLHAVFGDGTGLWAVGGNLLGGGSGAGGVILHFGLPTVPCTIETFEQPTVPAMECGTSTCPGGGGTAGPGDPCLTGNDCECMPGLECWYIVRPLMQGVVTKYNHNLCTAPCANADQCTADYGAGACCIIPGPQTTTRVCHWAGYTPVEGDPCMTP